MSFQDVLPICTRACRVGDSAIVCCPTEGDCLQLVENQQLLFTEPTLRSVVICHQTQLSVKLDRGVWELCEKWKARRESAKLCPDSPDYKAAYNPELDEQREREGMTTRKVKPA